MTKLYVGRLSDRTRESDLKAAFGKYGTIRSVEVKTGYAFVDFEEKLDAEDALKALDGADLNGGSIMVQFSHDSQGDRGPKKRVPGEGRCFRCGGEGHWARECTLAERFPRGGGGGGGGGYPPPIGGPRRRSPSPYRRRSPSPGYKAPRGRSRSPPPPYRGGGGAGGAYERRRSPSPPYRARGRRTPSPSYRRRSRSPPPPAYYGGPARNPPRGRSPSPRRGYRPPAYPPSRPRSPPRARSPPRRW